MVGQEDIIEQIDIMIAAAKTYGSPLGHVLISGPPGLGKSTLASNIALRSGTTMIQLNGALIKDKQEIITSLLSMEKNSILFIDEVHAVPGVIQEVLLTAMEGGWINVASGSSLMKVELEPFTFIAATTNPGKVIKPIRDRFSASFKMSNYSNESISSIVKSTLENLGIESSHDDCDKIASISLGVPRNAINIAKRCREVALSKGNRDIGASDIEMVMRFMKLNKDGLDVYSIDYMKYLHEIGGPVKLKSICAYLNASTDQVESIIEPVMIAKKYITINNNGRVLTQIGESYLCSLQ